MSLGAGETTLTDLIGAYAAMVNGGRLIEPSIVDRVQDRTGETIFLSDTRECVGCDVEDWSAGPART
jgi:penicillin-binding protein 1A